MKLVYLWIESYQCIKNQGYLLHSSYEVKYNTEQKALLIKERESIDSLLYGEKISITAIVGDNGVGKSTLLDAIRVILFDGEKRKREVKGFLLWENEKRLEFFDFMEEKISINTDLLCEKTVYFPNNFNLIYYSDFLDIKYYLEEFDDGDGEYIDTEKIGFIRERNFIQLNISTAYLLKKSTKGVLEYFHNDIKKQINFYYNLNKNILPFSIPNVLSIKIEFLNINIFDRVLDESLSAYEYGGMGHHGEVNTNAFVIGLLKIMERIYQKKIIYNSNPLDTNQILQWDILVIYIYNLLLERKQEGEEHNNYDSIDKKIKGIMSTIEQVAFWNNLDESFYSCVADKESFKPYFNFYHKVQRSLKYNKEGNFNVNFSIPGYMMQSLREKFLWKYMMPYIKINGNSSDTSVLQKFPDIYMEKNGWNGAWDINVFFNFYEYYTKIAYEIDFLQFSWGMSSGEISMFNLFSRLYSVMKIEEKDKIILLLDELDSTFHPQWQQDVIKSLTKFLYSMYPKKEFQIILTTHSPVLLSDIPEENIVFMRKDAKERKSSQTFAANIASLYYDSFFMEKGSIGEIARGSIINLLEAVSELEQEENKKGFLEGDRTKRLLDSFLQKQYPNRVQFIIEKNKGMSLLQKLIDSIGEDIWRYKVNEKVHNFLKEDRVDRKKEIWNKLKELEQKEGSNSVKQLFEQWMKEEENDSY